MGEGMQGQSGSRALSSQKVLFRAYSIPFLPLHTKPGCLPYDGFRLLQTPNGSRLAAMKISPHTKAVLTDSHFLVPLVVFCIGLALLITLH